MDYAHINARQKARLEQQAHEQKRKLAHANIVDLLKRQSEGQEVLAYAAEQVDKWRKGNLCSADYIQEWADLLAHPEQTARVLVEDSPRAVRLRQNTPFAAYLSR